jgi:YcxB-like protein
MKIQGQLEWTDYLETQLLHLRPTGWVRVALYIFLVLAGLAFIGLSYLSVVSQDFTQIETCIVPVLIVGVVFLLYRYVFLPRRIRQLFEQQKELSSPFEIEISDTGIKATNIYGYSNRPWSNFRKWKESSNLIMLYHSDVLFTMIPKRFCADQQIEAIHTYLKENKVPQATSSYRGCLVFMGVYLALLAAMGALFYLFIRSGPR